jgi:hypothetical protein
MIQKTLFGDEVQNERDDKYTTKIKAPIYEPKNKKPHILELCDYSKTKRLIHEIEMSGVDDEEKRFLIEAAKRHNVFNYSKIADYYAHATPEMQHLMERSALIILDFNKAIEWGYVLLTDKITSQFNEEYGNDEL